MSHTDAWYRSEEIAPTVWITLFGQADLGNNQFI